MTVQGGARAGWGVFVPASRRRLALMRSKKAVRKVFLRSISQPRMLMAGLAFCASAVVPGVTGKELNSAFSRLALGSSEPA